MKTTLIRRTFVGIAALALFWAAFGCSGEKKPASLEEGFLQYSEGEMTTFSISGQAKCDVCLEEEIPIVGWQLEIVDHDNPMNELGIRQYQGLGPFTVSNIKSVPQATLELLGTLYRDTDTGTAPIYGYAEVEVPDEDDTTVTVVLKFPSRDANN